MRLDETPDLIYFPLKPLADTTSIGQWKPEPSSINELRLISPFPPNSRVMATTELCSRETIKQLIQKIRRGTPRKAFTINYSLEVPKELELLFFLKPFNSHTRKKK